MTSTADRKRAQISGATDDVLVGLASNPNGVPFHCGDCEYYDTVRSPHGGKCRHKDPRLNGRKVDAAWCCNFFHHPGMKVIVR
jgi:hypothetical protein